jgi:hypothetical protein
VEGVRLAAQRRIHDENLRLEREKLAEERRALEALKPPLMKAVEVRNDLLLKPGLIGEYFGGANFESLCIRRIDPEPRWSTKGGQAWPDGPMESVSVRWQGYLRIPERGVYAVHASASEGMRVTIDNHEVVSNWVPRSSGPQVAMLYLDQGHHTVSMEYTKSGSWGGSVWLTCKKGTDTAAENLNPSHFLHDPALFTPVQRRILGLAPDRKSLPGAQEAEALKIVEAPPGTTAVLPIYSRGKGFLLWGKTKPGDRLVLQFEAPEDGEKTLVPALGRAKNGGIFRISVNGAVIAEKLDLYHPSNHFMEHDFKKVPLRKGANELEFTLLGSNKDAQPWSKDDGVHKLSIDYLRLR